MNALLWEDLACVHVEVCWDFFNGTNRTNNLHQRNKTLLRILGEPVPNQSALSKHRSIILHGTGLLIIERSGIYAFWANSEIVNIMWYVTNACYANVHFACQNSLTKLCLQGKDH